MLAQPIRDNLLACILVVLVAVMASELLGAASAGTWTWKGLTPLQGPAPEPRRHGVTIYDPVGKRVILFGGQGESGLLNDLWAFDLTSPAWSLLDDSGTAPAPRRGHNAIYDPVGHQMIVWAGQQGSLFLTTPGPSTSPPCSGKRRLLQFVPHPVMVLLPSLIRSKAG